MNRAFIMAVLFLVPLVCFGQKTYQPYEGQEFLRQVKLTKEYRQCKARADSANVDTNKIPQDVKFTIVREQQVGLDPDTLVGDLSRLYPLGIRLEQYTILYARSVKRIVSIKGGINANVQILK
ncbi:MAG: hypothetical protein JSS82_05945 [Bacteroidetes bacterium]|nr:hypothetical protein [Bacteroidota bacterium]